MTARPLALLWLLAPAALGQFGPGAPGSEPAPESGRDDAPPRVEHLDDGRLRLDGITFDPKSREIRFPAEVNMTEDLLEFLLVHRKGKVHESLFVTDISPTKLNVVFKLLRYPASRELHYRFRADGTLSGERETASDEERAGARLRIEVSWKDKDRERRASVNEWISNSATESPMPAGPWVYGGSTLNMGQFLAESSGDLVAIFHAESALVNYPGDYRENDEVWLPHATRVPAVGTPVTLLIRPYDTEP